MVWVVGAEITILTVFVRHSGGPSRKYIRSSIASENACMTLTHTVPSGAASHSDMLLLLAVQLIAGSYAAEKIHLVQTTVQYSTVRGTVFSRPPLKNSYGYTPNGTYNASNFVWKTPF